MIMNRALFAASFVLVMFAGTAFAEDWEVPRTPDGRPDLQGVWANNSATPMERPDVLEGRDRLTEEEVTALQARADEIFSGEADAAFGDDVFKDAFAAKEEHTSYDPTTGNYNQFWIVKRTFDERTSLVVDPPDGMIPALTAEGQVRFDAAKAYAKAHPADSYTDRINSDRCITFGVPYVAAGYNGYFQIAQTPDHVVVMQEMMNDSRVIPVAGGSSLDDRVRQWNGDPRGHWEDDVFVVETKNFSANSNFKGSSENLHLMERFSLVGPETLQWDLTISDATHWSKPWTMSILMEKSAEPIFEYACHEGNYAMEGILAGHRADEAKAAGTTAGGQ
jgi:hypothetical protein